MRASAGNADVPREHALFAARVLRELLGGREPALAAWALCGAARTRPLPSDVNAPPAEDELHATLLEVRTESRVRLLRVSPSHHNLYVPVLGTLHGAGAWLRGGP